MTGGFSEIVGKVSARSLRFDWRGLFVIGVLLGGTLFALLDSRFNVSFGDLKLAALPALRHRIILNFEAQAEGVVPDDIIRQIVEMLKTE